MARQIKRPIQKNNDRSGGPQLEQVRITIQPSQRHFDYLLCKHHNA